jgi:hypothetical protein
LERLSLTAKIRLVTNSNTLSFTAETGQIHFETATGGASTEKMIIGTTNLVINDIGAVYNVRIEGDTDANLFFTDATNSRVGIGTITPAEKLDVVGKIKVSDNIVIGTSGKGIDFSATAGTGTSELLADYEEGTFSPTLTTDGTDFTSVTYFANFNGGKYTKVGRLVTVQITLGTSAVTVGAASGNILIGNLPFTCAAHTAGTQDGFGSCALSQVQNFVVNQPDAGRVNANSTQIALYYRLTANGIATQLPVSDTATGFPGNIVVLTANYMTA